MALSPGCTTSCVTAAAAGTKATITSPINRINTYWILPLKKMSPTARNRADRTATTEENRSRAFFLFLNHMSAMNPPRGAPTRARIMTDPPLIPA